MVLKGNVSTIDNAGHKARVTFKSLNNDVTAELPVALHVGELSINDMVVVVFFSDNLADGLVISKF